MKGVSTMASRHPLLGPSLTINCTTCPVRGRGCDDCMVTAVLQLAPPDLGPSFDTPIPLDADEWAAVDRLAHAGLVSWETATNALARRVEHAHGGRRAVG